VDGSNDDGGKCRKATALYVLLPFFFSAGGDDRLDQQQLRREGDHDPAIKLIIADLSWVATLPSLTIALLVQLLNKCRARDHKLTLTGLQPQIRQVFAITKMDRVFRFANSVEAAMT
jgi:anti-anti-sigma factor